jgi:peptidyl-prolyl cis-trans isomerase C
VLFLLVAMMGCQRAPPEPVGESRAPATAASLEASLLDYYVTQQTGRPAAEVAESQRETLRLELQQLRAAAARPVGPDAPFEVELARLRILARSAAEAVGVYDEPGEQEIETAYRAYVESLPASEFEVSHILVPTEASARALIERLNRGEDFATLAREHSADDSAQRGGSLGWIHAGKLPAAFTDAVQLLQPGRYTPGPVQTPYGWHVIFLDARRPPAAPPPLEQVRAQLVANLHEQRYRQFLRDSVQSP